MKGRAVTLTDDERRGLVLPGDPHYTYFASLHTKPVATAPYVTLRPVEPRAKTALLLDVTGEGHCVRYVVAEDDTADAAPSDVVIGCAVSARILHVAVMALPDAQASLAWFGRLLPLAITAGGATAYVMPRRCCGNASSQVNQGKIWDAAAREYRDCPCRDCAAGRRWGW